MTAKTSVVKSERYQRFHHAPGDEVWQDRHRSGAQRVERGAHEERGEQDRPRAGDGGERGRLLLQRGDDRAPHSAGRDLRDPPDPLEQRLELGEGAARAEEERDRPDRTADASRRLVQLHARERLVEEIAKLAREEPRDGREDPLTARRLFPEEKSEDSRRNKEEREDGEEGVERERRSRSVAAVVPPPDAALLQDGTDPLEPRHGHLFRADCLRRACACTRHTARILGETASCMMSRQSHGE